MVTSKDKYAALTAFFNAGLSGDKKSYQRFLAAVTPILYVVTAKKLGANDVEDVVQEILLSIHKSRHTYDGKRPIMPWVMAIATCRITDYLRKLYAKPWQKMVSVDELLDVLVDVTILPDEHESIETLLKNSSERERAILTMIHLEGYTAKETGQQLGMKESAVKVTAHRAIKKIRENFGA